MTSQMITELEKYVVMMIKTFPQKRCISRTYSPHIIMTGKKLDFNKQCLCPFGAYLQAHNYRNITNKMIELTQGAICLGPTGNLQGTYAFLYVYTGRNMTCNQFIELPKNPRVPRRVIAMDMNENKKSAWSLRTVMGCSYL